MVNLGQRASRSKVRRPRRRDSQWDPGRGRTQLSESRVPGEFWSHALNRTKERPDQRYARVPNVLMSQHAHARKPHLPRSLSRTQLPTLRRYALHLRNHSPRSDRARSMISRLVSAALLLRGD